MGKETMLKKKTKVNNSILILFLVIDLVILNMHMNLKSYADRADMTENLLDRKKMYKIKGTGKLETADSQIHNTTCGTQGLYLISSF